MEFVLLAVFFLAILFLLVATNGRRRRHRDPDATNPKKSGGWDRSTAYEALREAEQRRPTPSGPVTVDEQLSALQATTISIQRPVNKSAYLVLLSIEQAIQVNAPYFRVLAEVGMGAFLRTTRTGDLLPVDKTAFGAFNSKRVDFLVIDGKGNPAFAVEYHGSGHHLGSTAAGRDAVKKEALRLAGIELVEIYDHMSDEERDILIAVAVKRSATGTGNERR